MTNDTKLDLDSIVGSLEKILEADETQFAFLESKIEGEHLSINGNKNGLIRIARAALMLASGKNSGNHFHFDSAGELDLCEQPFVVRYKHADWELN